MKKWKADTSCKKCILGSPGVWRRIEAWPGNPVRIYKPKSVCACVTGDRHQAAMDLIPSYRKNVERCSSFENFVPNVRM